MRLDWKSRLGVTLIVCELFSAPAHATRPCPPHSVLHDYVAKLRKEMPPRATASGPTTGIEVEGLIPTVLGIEGAQIHLMQFLESKGWRVSVEQGEGLFKRLVAVNAAGRRMVWMVGEDISIRAPSFRQMGIEIASPILSSSSDVGLFTEALESLRSIGMTQEPLSAGVHIHVGLPDPTPELIRDLNLIMGRVGPSMAKAFSQAKSREVNAAAIDLLEAEVAELMELAGWREHIRHRSRALNLQSLTRHGTVEFRIFNSTLDLEAITVMERFCRSIVQAVRNRDPRVVRLLERRGQHIEFAELAQALGYERADYQHVLDRLRSEVVHGMRDEILASVRQDQLPAALVVMAATMMGVISREALSGERQEASP